jgi:hypothetical protein
VAASREEDELNQQNQGSQNQDALKLLSNRVSEFSDSSDRSNTGQNADDSHFQTSTISSIELYAGSRIVSHLFRIG